MKSHSQRGMALVITLLLLAVVTFMAVFFLAISRRERSSVKVTEDQTDAKLMADAALARAQSQIVSRISASSNRSAFDLAVSTNFINPLGFQSGLSSPTNVSYVDPGGNLLTGNDLLQNIANLQYDPRPPVFVQTNSLGSNDFRFYIDFNRNRRFETNGLLPVLNDQGGFFDTNGNAIATFTGNVLMTNFVGDPEWVGVLEHPDRVHSDNNRFIGRYAFLILPAGKALDLNFIHNQANLNSSATFADNGFFRNQGYGSWEINLAAFLRDLNTNGYAWGMGTYASYNPLLPLQFPTGAAFNNAREMLRFRYGGSRNNLRSLAALFGSSAAEFAKDMIDNYSDGPVMAVSSPPTVDNDLNSNPWPGSDSTNAFYDAQDLLITNKVPADFLVRLQQTMSPARNSSYDRYTFYRLLAQMGVDSKASLEGKIHLNYSNDLPRISTNLVPWQATNFFLRAADALLKVSTNLFRNQFVFIGDTFVRSNISVTNIQIYYNPSAGIAGYFNTNNEYTASIHRLLQVAANIYDATTNRGASYPYYPSVFRPVFTGTSSNVVISGYVEETNSAFVSYPWREVEQLITASPTTYPNVNIYGQPVVIGAKKGFPNFNEFTLQTVVQVTRKLELRKPNANVNTRPNQTNQMYVLGISNLFGMEGWNSYAQDYRRPFEIRATNYYALALSNVVNGVTNLLKFRSGFFSTNLNGTNWPGNTNRYFFPTASSFILPIDTDYIFLTNSAYISSPPSFADSTLTNNFEKTFTPPLWHLYQTNRLQYILIDRVANRVLDFVNLDDMTTHMDIARRLFGETNAVRDLYSDAAFSEAEFWDTNRVSGPNSITVGALKQIQVSLGAIPVSQAIWRSFNNDPIAGDDKPKSIDAFRVFMGTNQLTAHRIGPLGVSHQAPKTPARKLYQKTSWQANDPLVHYMILDLFDPYLTNPDGTNNNAIISPPDTPLPESNLGHLNERYRPWGRNGQRTVTVNDFRYQTRDPLVWRSDDWSFPTNILSSNSFKFPTIGWLGRIHRGTPWQTIYFKSSAERTNVWLFWAGSYGTHPTNDWRFADVFSVAPNENAARGLLSVNQTNLAAWSAVLSGVDVISNTVPSATFASQPRTLPQFTDVLIQPASTQLVAIVAGINRTRSRYPGGSFQRIGDVLATPELTDLSPFLNLSAAEQYQFGISDQAYERLPMQILSLLKADEPRLVVYAFGQSLKPAERSLVTTGNFYNLCTNYQITGEVVTKTVLRVEGDLSRRNTPLRAVVESYNVLPPD